MMRIETLGVFPDMFEPIMSLSIMGRARRAGVFSFAPTTCATGRTTATARSTTPPTAAARGCS